MKKVNIIVIAICLFVFSCGQEDVIDQNKGNIQFSFSGNAGGRTEEDLTPSALLLTIEDADGNIIEQNKKLPVYSFGSSYVSESIQLLTGAYKLTQFLVLDADNKVIYATPVEDSELAQYVTEPLPIGFDVAENGSVTIIPQVLPVAEDATPESFGYVSFGFEVVGNNIIPKIKVWYRYIFNEDCRCFIPSSKSMFTYDENGLLVSLDDYANFDAVNGYKHNWHKSIEYFTERPDRLFYTETSWLVHSLEPNELHSMREIYLDEYDNLSSIKFYSNTFEGLKFTGEHKYEYQPSGFSIIHFIYNSPYQSKVEYELEGENIVQTINYDIHGNKVSEAFFTHGDKRNPLYDFYPLLTNSASLNNILKMTSGSYEENYSYTYSSEGYIVEMVMTASNGVMEKSIYEYY